MQHESQPKKPVQGGPAIGSVEEARRVVSQCEDVRAHGLVGHRIEVYWPKEKQWYAGCIVSYDARQEKHRVMYDDGDKEWEILDQGADGQAEWRDLLEVHARSMLEKEKRDQDVEARLAAAAAERAKLLEEFTQELWVEIEKKDQEVCRHGGGVQVGLSKEEAELARFFGTSPREWVKTNKVSEQTVRLDVVSKGEEHRRLRSHVKQQLKHAQSTEVQGVLVGSNEGAQKFRNLFMKLSLCQELFEAPRALCKHEVSNFQIRAISIGNNYPARFPTESMRRPKFHMLTYTMPRVAVKHRTVGLPSEQVIEVLHAVWNRRQRLHWSIKNKEDQLVAQCKDSQLQSTAFNTNAVQLFEIKTRRRQARRSIAGAAGVRSKQPMLSGVLQAAPVSQAISAQ